MDQTAHKNIHEQFGVEILSKNPFLFLFQSKFDLRIRFRSNISLLKEESKVHNKNIPAPLQARKSFKSNVTCCLKPFGSLQPFTIPLFRALKNQSRSVLHFLKTHVKSCFLEYFATCDPLAIRTCSKIAKNGFSGPTNPL